MTGVKFGMIIWTRIGGSCLGLLQTNNNTIALLNSTITADQNNVEVQSNINDVVKQSMQCCDRRTSSRTYAVGHLQRRMIVYYDRYDQFQQIPCGDFPREGLTGAKFGVKL